jgi:hypothetical protein
LADRARSREGEIEVAKFKGKPVGARPGVV